jgi:solute carrier family 6 amino acid transporter-like protein 5/7/9/14
VYPPSPPPLCYSDAVLVSILDCVTSVFAGLVIFSIIGYMAHTLHQPVDQVANDGPGLAFVVYPDVVTKLPVPQLWSVLFFAMLITLGLGTQIATVTTVHTTLLDQFSDTMRKGRNSTYLLLGISLVGFLVGLSFCTQGGMYIVTLFDNYAATYSLLAIGLVECVALAWVYGAERLFSDIELMLGKRPGQIWAHSWHFIAPIALFAILVFTWVDFQHSFYGAYVFPMWADSIGIVMTFMSVMAIPIVAGWKIFWAKTQSRGESITEIVKKLSRPTADWGPRLKEHRMLMKASQAVPMETYESQRPMLVASTSDLPPS